MPTLQPMTTSARAATFSDSYVHLINYIQEGPVVRRFLELMGTRLERSARRRDRDRKVAQT